MTMMQQASHYYVVGHYVSQHEPAYKTSNLDFVGNCVFVSICLTNCQPNLNNGGFISLPSFSSGQDYKDLLRA